MKISENCLSRKSSSSSQKGNKMKKWCMVIDIEKCENCNNCFMACKDEHYNNDWPGYTLSQPLHGHRWINILKKEHGEFPHIRVAYLPKPCLHCDNPPCVNGNSGGGTVSERASINERASLNGGEISEGAIYKRQDGIVIIDQQKAKGERELLKRCPHGAIWWNEERGVAQKCTMCAHLLDEGWREPRCVQACPTGALTFHAVEEEEFDTFIQSERLENLIAAEALPAEVEGHSSPDVKISHAGVLYKNLHLYKCCFIAGSVATGREAVEECVADATVELYHDNTLIAQKRTDSFGDYRFDGLKRNSGTYQIRVTDNQKHAKTVEVTLGESSFTGVTWI